MVANALEGSRNHTYSGFMLENSRRDFIEQMNYVSSSDFYENQTYEDRIFRMFRQIRLAVIYDLFK